LSKFFPPNRRLGELTWAASRQGSRNPVLTFVLKLKTAEFKILTRQSHAVVSAIFMELQQRFRLGGVGLSNFFEPEGATRSSGV
jgi:hypothetical protein